MNKTTHHPQTTKSQLFFFFFFFTLKRVNHIIWALRERKTRELVSSLFTEQSSMDERNVLASLEHKPRPSCHDRS